MKNRHRIIGNVVVVMVKYKGKRMFTYVSLESLPKLLEFSGSWSVKPYGPTKTHWYVYSNRNKMTYRLHRFVTDAPANMVVDHKDRNTLNNTLENLEIMTQTENMQNKSVYRNNKTGIPGIHWVEKYQVYVATYKSKYVGQSKIKEEAIAMRMAKIKEEAYYENIENKII